MNEEVLILSANKYDFVDKDTNRKNRWFNCLVMPVKQNKKEVMVKPLNILC